jgi:hypothetical protein
VHRTLEQDVLLLQATAIQLFADAEAQHLGIEWLFDVVVDTSWATPRSRSGDPYAVTMIAITDGLMLRAWRSTSSPSTSGMRASETTRSKGFWFNRSMAPRPLSATDTSCPSRFNRIASISRIDRSSSTTRIRADSTAGVRSAVALLAITQACSRNPPSPIPPT